MKRFLYPFFVLFFSGCSSLPIYKPVPKLEQNKVLVKNYHSSIRQNGETSTYFDDKTCLDFPEENNEEISYLAISGGSDKGAYAAGFLNGWSDAGGRPEFDIVTGVSTGALIAPFAFLGKDYDSTLKKMYTTMKEENIFVSGFVDVLDGLTGGMAVADTSPLREQLEFYITEEIVEKIAVEHRNGRRLYMSSTNLDSQKPIIWNIGEIANSGREDSIDLIHNIMLASSAIPGVFPPVFFDVEYNGNNYKEVHVDGSVVSNVLFPPDVFEKKCGYDRKMYIIRNSKLHSEYEVVKPSMFNIFSRSIASVVKYQAYGDLYRMYVVLDNNDIDYNLTYIPDDFDHERENPVFDIEYMRALYDRAYKDSNNNFEWKKNPF
ncbi:MAG: patatin-like phospholipase family protein [Alphaproteobacteria bacterium]|jgi:predicted patatin/cPLA2 family phospholipase|nr:patatin-like phospholipase family protein [Alphaproteobacteria bacterium]